MGMLAAGTPAPGAGTAAALSGATAAALSEMVASFALTRTSAGDPELVSLRDRATALRTRLLALADDDLSSYAPVLDALALPSADASRAAAVSGALSSASEVPLEIAAACGEVAELAGAIADAPGNGALAGDASAAILLACAATCAAARLVELNLAGTPRDPRAGQAAALAKRARELHARAICQ
jgi:methenyltetrahydrofolate cyclohydrolase